MVDVLSLLQFGAGGWGDELLSGLLVTLELCFMSLPAGLAMGLGLAFAQRSRFRILREMSSLLTSLVRGIPELLTLFLIYFGGQIVINSLAKLLGTAPFSFDGFVAGSVTLSILFASYSSEVFAGVLEVLSRTSMEAAKSLALGRLPTLVFVTLPELFGLSIPGLSNLWLSIVKQTRARVGHRPMAS